MRTTEYTIGQKIKSARENHNPRISQLQLGNALGISANQVSKYEKGRDLSVSRLVEIAKALDKPLAWFFETEEQQTTSQNLDAVCCENVSDVLRFIDALETVSLGVFELRKIEKDNSYYNVEYDRDIVDISIEHKLVFTLREEIAPYVEKFKQINQLYNGNQVSFDLYSTFKKLYLEEQSRIKIHDLFNKDSDNLDEDLPF